MGSVTAAASMERPADRSAGVGAGVEAGVGAGVLAGLAGFAVFLVLHHAWIVPIWFIAPVGAVMAAGGGAAVGAAYGELRPRLPPRPWTVVAVWLGIAAILAPAVVVAQLGEPLYAIGDGGEGGTLLVSGSQAVAAFVVGLLGTATVSGAALGLLVGRTRRAAGLTALAGFALAIGPGHNIPFLGATPAVPKELAILAAVTATASVVLVIRGPAGAPGGRSVPVPEAA